MAIHSCRNHLRNITLTLWLALVFSSSLFAQEEDYFPIDNKGYVQSNVLPETKKGTVIFNEDRARPGPTEKNLTEIQRTARIYRREGYRLQGIGNMVEAMVFYQKAVELDPSYAVAYNDLGIIYESKGMTDHAEENYLRAIKADPAFLSAYSNLALVYENKRDLEKAQFYWQKRAQLGLAGDPWTEKARQRLEDIRMVLSDRPFEDAREKEILDLLKELEQQKYIFKQDSLLLAFRHFEKAKQNFKKGDFATAIKEALDAQQLDPSNNEIEKFIEKAQLRALSE